ncbi:hypothetical protein FA95DRAFT_1566905 [Auriscalpium vulgare]|uniref:Uncharacterized protein n=2 Tax=Auriscalpium vulgare TaxID=40419 RepID=A0ACB8R638_9AGAM|nr:hypothetical protein FA95DRAFT_1567131 [Auriscalpium vulgare]KAI0039833.1 hypothetical protein FA95DRAFT_1566905 [Auriscalpium vulgare]
MGGNLGNITQNEFLSVPDAKLTADCSTQCAPGTQAIQACNNDDSCLCTDATIASVVACQQCMFADLIQDFRKMPDLRAGSVPALSAYGAACNASDVHIVVPPAKLALALPASWNGPTGEPLNLGGTIAYVASGAILSIGSIVILCTM